MRLLAPLLISVVVSASLACSSEPDASTDDSVDDALVQSTSLASEDQRALRHASQGADWIPYSVLRALRVPNPLKGQVAEPDEVSFLDPRIQRPLRLLRDEDSGVDGLPIGLTVGVQSDLGYVGVGQGCAACHVAEWHYTGDDRRSHVMRVYGAPNTFDPVAWFDALASALKDNVWRPGFWERVKQESDRIDQTYPVLAMQSRTFAPDPVDRAKDIVLWMLDLKSDDSMVKKYGAERMRLLASRGFFFKGVMKRIRGSNGHVPGPGRLDMPTALRSIVTADRPWKAGSFPSSANHGSWYFVAKADWFQVNENISSSVLRDIAETATAGAAVDMLADKPTFATSVDFEANTRIDGIVTRAVPPEWPADVSRDASLAARGEEIYKQSCRSCHEPRTTSRGLLHFPNVACEAIGVDCGYAQSYLEPYDDSGVLASERLTGLFSQVRDRYYRSRGIGAAEALRMEDVYDASLNPGGKREPGKFRFTNGYRAKPLDGVWATAPFLHNGSVPTIADLLKPAAERPKKFWLGHRAYDLSRVGLRVIAETEGPQKAISADFLYDTTLPGNGNQGHEFGTRLPEEDKRALLEFLKGLGAGKSSPTVYDGFPGKVPEAFGQ